MSDNNIISKLQKLLALAGSDNVHEAELAMQRAQELSTKHRIDLSRVHQDTKVRNKLLDIVRLNVAQGKRFPIHHSEICSLIKLAFNVKIINCGSRYVGKTIAIFGTDEEVRMAEYMYSFLYAKFLSLWRKEKTKNNYPLKYRASFFWGLHDGMKQKMEEKKRELEGELEGDDKNRYSLTLSDQMVVIDNTIAEHFSNLRKGRTKTINLFHGVYEHGVTEGRKIEVARPLR